MQNDILAAPIVAGAEEGEVCFGDPRFNVIGCLIRADEIVLDDAEALVLPPSFEPLVHVQIEKELSRSLECGIDVAKNALQLLDFHYMVQTVKKRQSCMELVDTQGK